jgi:hypothetical protein
MTFRTAFFTFNSTTGCYISGLQRKNQLFKFLGHVMMGSKSALFFVAVFSAADFF